MAETISDLRCPNCKAMNRPGATCIQLDQTGTRAECAVCAYEGPLAFFKTDKGSTGR